MRTPATIVGMAAAAFQRGGQNGIEPYAVCEPHRTVSIVPPIPTPKCWGPNLPMSEDIRSRRQRRLDQIRMRTRKHSAHSSPRSFIRRLRGSLFDGGEICFWISYDRLGSRQTAGPLNRPNLMFNFAQI
jgi:hypothetical protein